MLSEWQILNLALERCDRSYKSLATYKTNNVDVQEIVEDEMARLTGVIAELNEKIEGLNPTPPDTAPEEPGDTSTPDPTPEEPENQDPTTDTPAEGDTP